MAVRRSSADMPGAAAPDPPRLSDPTWSLRPWPVQADVAGRTVWIPARPAADWLTALFSTPPDWEELLFQYLDEETTDAVYDALAEGDLTFEDLGQLCRDVVEVACARPWWVALRLIAYLRDNWATLGGQMLRAGHDPERLSISAWLDICLLTAIEGQKNEDVTIFFAQLEAPPPGVEIDESSMEMTAEEFMALGKRSVA